MELDVEMKSLQINDRKRHISADENASKVDKSAAEGEPLEQKVRRSLRLKVPRLEVDKRRVQTKPQKFDADSFCDITSYYLNKKVTKVHSSLETIFEEPKSDGETVMSHRKLRRLINFQVANLNDKMKTKKRHVKAKKLCLKKRIHKSKVTHELLLRKLAELEDVK